MRRIPARVDQRAVHEPASTDPMGRKLPGHAQDAYIASVETAAGQPDFMAGPDFGRDRGHPHRQFVDPEVAQRAYEMVREAVAAD